LEIAGICRLDTVSIINLTTSKHLYLVYNNDNKKLSYRLKTGVSNALFIAKLLSITPLHTSTSVMSDTSSEPADLLHTRQINFSYDKMHATAVFVLTCDATVV